jgi:hypothetical protein
LGPGRVAAVNGLSIGQCPNTSARASQIASARPAAPQRDPAPARVPRDHPATGRESPDRVVGVPVRRGGDQEGAGIGDRFAQQADQRVVNALVLDTSGREQKPHACFLYVAVMMLSSTSRDIGCMGKQTVDHIRNHRRLRPSNPRPHIGM